MTPLSLSDTDPAELAVDAIVVGLHTADGDGGPLLAPGRGERGRRVRRAAGRDAGPARRDRRGRRGDQAGHAGHRLGPGDRGGRARARRREDGTTPPRRCAGRPPRPSGRWPGRPRSRWRCRRRTAHDAGRPLRAIAEGALLGTYRFAGYKTKPQPGRRDPVKAVSLHVTDAADKAAKAEAEARRPWSPARSPGPATGSTRRPTSCARPTSPTEVAKAATDAGLEVEVLDEKALKKAGYGGILAVGMGSDAPPRLVTLALRRQGRDAPSGRPGRQGHHVRHRRLRDQAGAGHVGDEVRHVGRGGGRRR